MPRTLKHSITSDYLIASRALAPKGRRKRVVAYVESYDDVAFWRAILSRFETPERYFEVMLPVTRDLTRGKKTVLISSMKSTQFGQGLIACVDSDYDFLIQGATETSRKMMDCDYVFQTYGYAIESLRCYAPSLHEVCVRATMNDHRLFDFERFLQTYSEIVYPLFLWNIYFYRKADLNTFPMHRLHEATALRRFELKNPQAALDSLKYRVQHELHYWQERFSDQTDAVQAQQSLLAELGLKPQNTYLYMQGHHIFDNVVLKVMGPVCAVLRREQEDSIRRKACHVEQLDNELAGYANSTSTTEKALRKNESFRELFLYQWIINDLTKVYGQPTL